MVAEPVSRAEESLETLSRRYKSRQKCDADRSRMERDGWRVLSRMAVERRRRAGLLLGVVGYWLLPKRAEVDVIYVRSPD
ncbi:MAG: hypothetical protein ACE5EF_03450 [Dehalococcoidia bacterium]